MREEGFAPRIGGEEGGGDQGCEGADGEDEAAFAGDEAGEDELRDAKGGGAVDVDDVEHFVLGGVGEGNGDRVAFADVVDEDGDVEGGD